MILLPQTCHRQFSPALRFILAATFTMCGLTPQPAFSEAPLSNDTLPPVQASWVQTESLSANLITTPNFPNKQWWESFNDPVLNQLVQQALNNNYQLKQASSIVDQAFALARMQFGRELPQINVAPSFSRQKFSENLLSGLVPGGSAGGNSFNAPGRTLNFYTLPFNASYEVDIFGKNRNRTKQANTQVLNQQEQLNIAIARLLHQVVITYRQLQLATAWIDTQHDIIAQQKKLLELHQLQLKHGYSRQDVPLMTDEGLQQSERDLASYVNLQALAHNQLALLTGQTPAEIETITPLPLADANVLAHLPVGNPAELFENRPDIRAAEHTLEQTRLDVGLAKKAYLPDWTINGQFGWASTQLSNWLDWKSNTASIATSVVQSLFTGGQRKANKKRARAAQQQALALYQQTLLNSFTDVENSLSGLNSSLTRHSQLSKQLGNLNARLALTQQRITHGHQSLVDELPISIQQEELGKMLLAEKAEVLVSQANVYKALGSGL